MWTVKSAGVVFEHAQELADDVALQAPLDLTVGLAPSLGLGLGLGIVAEAGEHDGVERLIESAVTRSIHSVAEVIPEQAGIGAAPASIANAASMRNRPGCDHAQSTVSATILS